MKKPKTKAAAKPDFVHQSELRSIVALQDIAADLAVEVRRRILNGARVQKGKLYRAKTSDGPVSISSARHHREKYGGTSLGRS